MLNIQERVKKIIKECENLKLTAYEIAQSTGLSTTGVQKILDNNSKKPREKTLQTIENYITNKKLIPAADHYKFSNKSEDQGDKFDHKRRLHQPP